jgi:uncharacterized protein YebE (UPF0316 family)
MQFLDSNIFSWVILPLLIFCSRIFDVSLGTIRIIFVSRGNRAIAPLLGFFEVLIWLIAIGKIMQNLTNVAAYLAYAGGFATGNYLGIVIEQKLAVGLLAIRVITSKDASSLIQSMKEAGYGVTVVDAMGNTGKVNLLYSVIKRSKVQDVVEMIKRFNPKAFYSVEEVKHVHEGITPLASAVPGSRRSRLLKTRRKGK